MIIKENNKTIIEKFLINLHWVYSKNLFLTTEKIDASSAKSLGLECSPLGKQFMDTKKRNVPKIDLCRLPTLMEDHLDH